MAAKAKKTDELGAKTEALLKPLPKTVQRKLPKGTMIDGIDCSGMIDDGKAEGIPVYLQVQNRRPLTPEQQAKVDEMAKARAATAENVVAFGKPKGMSMEEWEAHKSRERQAKDAAKAERLAKLPKKAKKAEPPANSFRLIDLAEEENMDDREVRRIARANVDKLKPLEIGGKYVYANKSRDDVLKIIKAGVKVGTKGGGKAKKAKLKIPPPSETVWSGKAKVKSDKGPPPEQASKKADDRVLAKAAAKGRKRIKVEGGAMLIKRRAKK